MLGIDEIVFAFRNQGAGQIEDAGALGILEPRIADRSRGCRHGFPIWGQVERQGLYEGRGERDRKEGVGQGRGVRVKVDDGFKGSESLCLADENGGPSW